jgi:L-ascorbate metabolism protein UlaG (beta-lactamase superfamily)
MNSDRLTYIGHSTVLIEIDGTRLLTDPLLRSRVGPLMRHGALPAAGVTDDLDALLISHLHRDHADIASLRKLSREVPVLAPPGSRAFFERRGFSRVTELAPGESTRAGALTVTAVEARHDVSKRRHAHRSEAIGFLIVGASSVYFAGDTDIFEGMEQLAPGLDLALLPIWGWGPNVGVGHLDPRRAAKAAALLTPRIAVPIHWGTLYPVGLSHLRSDPLRLPGGEFTRAMRELAPQVATRVLSPGEATSLA